MIAWLQILDQWCVRRGSDKSTHEAWIRRRAFRTSHLKTCTSCRYRFQYYGIYQSKRGDRNDLSSYYVCLKVVEGPVIIHLRLPTRTLLLPLLGRLHLKSDTTSPYLAKFAGEQSSLSRKAPHFFVVYVSGLFDASKTLSLPVPQIRCPVQISFYVICRRKSTPLESRAANRVAIGEKGVVDRCC